MAPEALLVAYLVIVGMERAVYNNLHDMRNWLGAGDCQSWDASVLGTCCTRC